MQRLLPNEKAFTLIEIIVSLVLLGIMAAIAGMGLVRITEGYVFARQNAETAQKAQVAMARIVKELAAATAISSANATSVTFDRPGVAGNIIQLSGQNITLGLSGTPAILMDNVATFTLIYYDNSGNVTTTPANVKRVDIAFTVNGANNTSLSFNNSININRAESY